MEERSGLIISEQHITNMLIVMPEIDMAENIKKSVENENGKVLDIIVVIDHIITSIEEQKIKGNEIHGIVIRSSISKNALEGKRLELFADIIVTVRTNYPDIEFVIISDEEEGHPVLAELFNMGIYNIFTRNGKTTFNINELVNLIRKPSNFAFTSHLRNVNREIAWRNSQTSTLGARELNVNIEHSHPTAAPVVIEKEKIVEVERERIVTETIYIEKIKEVRVEPKKIVIGSAYAGAGSSFITIMLSRILSQIGVANAVVEHPVIEPSLYAMLSGEGKLPNEYQFISEQIKRLGTNITRKTEWNSENSYWYPIHPKGLEIRDEWEADDTIKLLYQIKEPIVFIDVSHCWSDPSVYEICLGADEIYFVLDTELPLKFHNESTKKNSNVLFELERLGKSVNIIANKDLDLKYRTEWLRSLPMSPIGIVQKIAYEKVIEAIWNNEILADNEEIRKEIAFSLYSVLKKIVPKDFSIAHLKRTNGIFGKLFRKKEG